MGLNVSVIKLVFVASTVNLLFKLNLANFNTNRNRHEKISMRKAQHLFEEGVNSREACLQWPPFYSKFSSHDPPPPYIHDLRKVSNVTFATF